MMPTRRLFDYEVAAELYSRCRVDGFNPANTNDLLIAAVAIGKQVPLLAAAPRLRAHRGCLQSASGGMSHCGQPPSPS